MEISVGIVAAVAAVVIGLATADPVVGVAVAAFGAAYLIGRSQRRTNRRDR